MGENIKMENVKDKKIPIAVLLTDTHLGEKSISINKSVWKQADELAFGLGVEIFHLGDVFNSRKSQTLSVLSAFDDILDDLKSFVHVIAGNHDRINYRSENSYLDPFKYNPKMRVYRMMGAVPVGGVIINMLPYFLEEDKYLEMLSDMVNNNPNFNRAAKNVLLTHVAVTGVKNNDTSVVVNEVRHELFKAFEAVFIGHYHDISEVGNKMRYIGSAYQANFGEDDKKGATILYNDLTFEHRVFDFPKYVVEEINLDDLELEQIERIHQHHSNSDDFIRFKFRGSEEKLKALDKAKYEKDGIDVAVVNESIEKAIEAATGGELVAFNKSSVMDAFREFCDEKGLEWADGERYLKKHLA